MLLLFDVEITSIYRARVQRYIISIFTTTLCWTTWYSFVCTSLIIICVHAVYRRYKLNHLWSTYFWLSRCSVCSETNWLGSLFVPIYWSFQACLLYVIIYTAQTSWWRLSLWIVQLAFYVWYDILIKYTELTALRIFQPKGQNCIYDVQKNWNTYISIYRLKLR